MDDQFDRDYAAWAISEQIRLAAEAAAEAAAATRRRLVIDLAVLVLSCAPLVAQDTARALIQVESGGNPFAIGVVGGALVRQPANLPEAVATVAALEAAGWNYSVGLGQINKRNFQRFGLNPQTAFEPCANLTAMQGILGECFSRASRRASTQTALARRLQLLLLRQLP
jgi:soluble lytic murein transglycosylase-like protein